MIENLAGTEMGPGAVRQTYVKPFVRKLDASVTEGAKSVLNSTERTLPNPPTATLHSGPS